MSGCQFLITMKREGLVSDNDYSLPNPLLDPPICAKQYFRIPDWVRGGYSPCPLIEHTLIAPPASLVHLRSQLHMPQSPTPLSSL